MAWSGTVKSVKSDPRGAVIQPPGDPPPAPVALTDISDDAWDLLCDEFDAGGTISGTGTPPVAGSVTRSK